MKIIFQKFTLILLSVVFLSACASKSENMTKATQSQDIMLQQNLDRTVQQQGMQHNMQHMSNELMNRLP